MDIVIRPATGSDFDQVSQVFIPEQGDLQKNRWQVNAKAILFYKRQSYTTMRRTIKAILEQGSAGATVNQT